ncbi:breast carcinoma-amplified sequence 4 [Lynx pardinus]|uniref:Breast carcinoma-amplified sequence 4 n=1 Tax=Lynx pardinus TaxID=191816 RepID=A0A485NWU1_LYNPA|nr:breast carcinoma-amplified sequence 4 [Lynx pardinus]
MMALIPQRSQERATRWHSRAPMRGAAFVKMVGHHVSFLEAHVLQAERDHGAFSQALRRWLGSSGLPSFRNKSSTPAPLPFELPALYRTEDYFPGDAGDAPRTPSRRRHRRV